ncbi:hypothetical protein NEIMUCOT_04716 [Neisseria mucosa ATCC 25996]|uniref:Uncharacterized protein n=2 Tax=Neisseria mucosa TaxID=488 RepID=D2ZVS4_NEIM2|nr:hypothetical protein NEIMUCOT_04716 [Neisseria mucosa ATCC 25996]
MHTETVFARFVDIKLDLKVIFGHEFFQLFRQLAALLAAQAGIPNQITARLETFERVLQGLDNAAVILFFLIGRVDQYHGAARRRGKQRNQSAIAVSLRDLPAFAQTGFFHVVLQMRKIGRMKLEQAKFVAFSGEKAGKPGRAAVEVFIGQDFFQTTGKVGQIRRQRICLKQTCNPLPVFADLLCLLAAQIIQTRAAVGVDIPIRFVFEVEIFQRKEEGEMFEHIGVIAGMEGVAVAEHGRGRLKTGKGDYIRKCGRAVAGLSDDLGIVLEANRPDRLPSRNFLFCPI